VAAEDVGVRAAEVVTVKLGSVALARGTAVGPWRRMTEGTAPVVALAAVTVAEALLLPGPPGVGTVGVAIDGVDVRRALESGVGIDGVAVGALSSSPGKEKVTVFVVEDRVTLAGRGGGGVCTEVRGGGDGVLTCIHGAELFDAEAAVTGSGMAGVSPDDDEEEEEEAVALTPTNDTGRGGGGAAGGAGAVVLMDADGHAVVTAKAGEGVAKAPIGCGAGTEAGTATGRGTVGTYEEDEVNVAAVCRGEEASGTGTGTGEGVRCGAAIARLGTLTVTGFASAGTGTGIGRPLWPVYMARRPQCAAALVFYEGSI
jgi:hypothetical protein